MMVVVVSQPKGVFSDLREDVLHNEEWTTELGVVGPGLEIVDRI